MARLVGILLLLGGVLGTVVYSLDHAPRPAGAAGQPAARITRGVSPTEALAFAGPSPVPEIGGSPEVARWVHGIYEVGPSPNPREARFNRAVRPRRPLFEGIAADVRGYDAVDEFGSLGDRTLAAMTPHGQIPPGLYATPADAEACTYQLHRVMKRSRAGRVIGEDHLETGRLLVTLNGIEPDWFTSSPGCGGWNEWRPRPSPTAPAGNGDYWRGDLAPGQWIVPADCLWEEVVAFRGAALRDVVANGRGPAVLTIDDTMLGLRVRGCLEPLRLHL